MSLYRKRPVVVEARQLTRENFHEVGEWAGVTECWELTAPIPALLIDTLEGVMKAFPGDWVVKGVKGEVYPVRADVFALTYEPAPEVTP